MAPVAIAPDAGHVSIAGADLKSMERRALARRISIAADVGTSCVGPMLLKKVFGLREKQF